MQDFLLQNTIGFEISNQVVKGASEIYWHWTVLFWLWESRKQLSQPMQSAQRPTGTVCHVSGLTPSQPHPKPLLPSVQSHEVTIFPSTLAEELCFKNRVMGKPLFTSQWSFATLEVLKYQFNNCTSHVAKIKGCAEQKLTLKIHNRQLHRHYVTQWALIKYILGQAGMSLSIKPMVLKNRRPNSLEKKHAHDLLSMTNNVPMGKGRWKWGQKQRCQVMAKRMINAMEIIKGEQKRKVKNKV